MENNPLTNTAAATVSALRHTLELARAQLSTLALADGRSQIIQNDERAIIPPPPHGSSLHALYVMLRSVEESLQQIVAEAGSNGCSMIWLFESPDTFMVASSGAVSSEGPERAASETKRILGMVLSELSANPEHFK